MKWNKKGQIFEPKGQFEYMNSHTCPINAVVLDEVIRVFFSTRAKIDKEGNYVSQLTYVDLDKKDPHNVIYINEKPLLPLGEPGSFDEYGIMGYKSVFNNGKLYLYYGGWQRLQSTNAPYQVELGLAVSDNNGKSFEKISNGPVMGRDIYNPFSIGNVFPIIKDGKWYLFYTSFTRWEYEGGKATPEYNIKLAYSDDGINWLRNDKIIIQENEKGGIATPCVFFYKGKYRMLFGYRNAFDSYGKAGRYSIGYAESDNLLDWNRDDGKAGLVRSESGWDSEMVCYPHVVEVDGKLLMFYCGNGYGATGFGYAELDE